MALKICLILSLFIYSSFSLFLPAIYQQCDPRWKDVTLGFGSETICDSGSLLTSASSIADGLHFNGDLNNPLRLNAWLKANGGFDKDNKFVWESLSPLGLKFEGFLTKVNEIIDAFIDEKVLILQVKGTNHYVVPEAIVSGGFVMMDPQSIGDIFYKPSDIIGAGVYKY